MPLYWMQVKVTKVVHMQALGFTDWVPMHAWGDDENEALGNVTSYLVARGSEVARCPEVKRALEQDPARYTFPEQIVGLPDDVARAAIVRKRFPASIEQDTLETLSERQQALERGRRLLAERPQAVGGVVANAGPVGGDNRRLAAPAIPQESPGARA